MTRQEMQEQADDQYAKLKSLNLTEEQINLAMEPLLAFFLSNWDEEIVPAGKKK